jgi:hypothetical protein
MAMHLAWRRRPQAKLMARQLRPPAIATQNKNDKLPWGEKGIVNIKSQCYLQLLPL